MTDRNRVERDSTLRSTDADLFASVFQHAPIGMAITGFDGVILDVNPAFCRMIGQGRDDLLGASIPSLTHPVERETIVRIMQRLARRELPSAETEWRFLARDGGEHRARLAMSAANATQDGAAAHLVIQAQDITAERAAESARIMAERRFRAFIEEVPAAIFLVPMDKAGAPAYISPQVERMLGYTPDDLTTDRDFLFPLVHPDERTGFRAENERSDATLEPFHTEVRLRHRDGHWVWVSIHSTVTRGPDGTPTGWQGVIVDITATRSAQERLRAAQRMYGALVSTIPAITYRCPPDALGTSRFEYLSPQASLLLGYDLDTLLSPGMLRSLIHPSDLPALRANAQSAMDGGQAMSLYRIRAADGRWHWLRDEAVLISDEFGRPVSWHGAAFDITAEKEAAVRIGEAEARYHAIVDNIPAFTYVMHPGAIRSWRFSYLSPKLESILGYPPETFPRSGDAQDEFFDRLIHPDDLAAMNTAIDRQVDAGIDRIVDFYRLRAADGSWRWIRDEAVLLRDSAGEPMYWHAAGLDVTTEREAERRVSEAVSRYRGLVDNLPAAVLLWNAPTIESLVYASPGAEIIFGCDAAEITGSRAFLGRVHPDDLPGVRDGFASAFTSGDPWTGEFRVRGEGSRWRWVSADLRLVLDGDGRPAHWQGLLLDVTARAEAEAALAEREGLLRAVFERGGVAINMTDASENFISANPAFCAFLGYSEDELLTMNFRQIAHPDDLGEDVGLHDRLLAGAIDQYHIKMRYLRKDGSIVWGLASVALVRDADGSVRCTIGQVQDITDLHDAERAVAESERLFRSAFDAAPVGMALVGPDARILDANPVFCEMLGASRDALAGLTYADITAPTDVESNRDAFSGLRDGLTDRFTLTKRYRRADGSEFTGRLSVSAVRDEHGRLLRAISQVEDVTAREAAERERTLGMERLRTLVQNLPDAIIVTDAEGVILQASPAAEALLGIAPERLTGQYGLDLAHPDDIQTVSRIRRDSVLRPGAPVTCEARLRGADGEWRWFQIILTNHLRTPGINGMIASLRDITGRKQAELAMAEANRLQGKALAELRGAGHARQDFLAFLNHEFRTPLTGISGYAQLLARGQTSDDDVQRYSAVISRESARMSTMVSDLLLLDRAERGDLALDRVSLPVAAIVDERVLAAAAEWPGREIASDLEPGLTAPGDARLLSIALGALLDNALRYSGPAAPVTIRARRDEGMVHLSVSDRGIGIPADQVDRIFDRFHRVRNGQARFIPGNGLGLTVAREIVTLHAGRIWAESAEGEGTTLHLLLPRM